ncbi:MAG: type II secretion system F family protein, partial [Spirochaetales bacterium]|nr:type II secretion system F family protein [Spirochaetales bacterium]
MADFLCKCVDSRGKMRTQWLKGAARDSLVHQAALRGFTLISVLKEKEPAAAGGSKKKRLNEKLVLEWSLALRSLLKGGITVREAIGIVGQVSPYRQLKDLCGHAVSRIDGGSTLMEALEDYQSGFSPVYTGLIAAGERTGRLDSVLESLIAQMKRSRKLKEKMVSAAVYPAIVMSALVLGLLLLFLVVLPRVAASFADMGMGADLSALAGKAIRSGLAIAAVTGTLVL